MKIEQVNSQDVDALVELISYVASSNILPSLSEEGRKSFISSIHPDVETALDLTRFQSFKVTVGNEIIAFGAIRDSDYITHLFVDSRTQKNGVGKRLLHHLLSQSSAREVGLKSSVNAVGFYESQGFTVTDTEQNVKGIRYVPMSWLRT
ncbi:GNAT family N-acetyltransferase [Vibrio diabolicus]|uniref:GNAT family N-acetyltransferase n=1 Tax=Vibrio diabolicus TaxID=50719 RepID=UPI00215EA41D|nr:GNAT family N-acetyltransferase [Vibrio diabolicus]EIT7141935.1 GNAT family N-acetyltransferase [Vibrio parahaemolyticus]MCS0377573.1 GNAT family N-acetyltransferase [Vibrio diabolicus]MCS0421884.1 GNAT family N-acetyltransferase [Vibrio diabolicus]